jgi:pimeloyl-ACP methyl ester carboxylesterase
MILISIIALIISWFIIDIYRYIRYNIACKLFNETPDHRDTNHQNIQILLRDLDKYPDIFEMMIKDLFFGKIMLENMNYDDVCLSLFEMIGEYDQYRDEIKRIVKRFQLKMRSKNINVFTSNVRTYRVRSRKHGLKSWFIILPVYIMSRVANIIITIYMKLLGYQSKKCGNGLVIWYSKYDPALGTPLVFFHASVGGLTVHYPSLAHFYKNHNIILPEIPGISFIDTDDKPFPISSIIENVHNFLLTEYISDQNKCINPETIKINLMGHSLGSAICSSYINTYPKNIDSFFCVEGQIFFHRIMKISHDLNSDIHNTSLEDLIAVSLFNRNLYVQYFLIKCMTIDYSMLYDLKSDEKKHIKIHMYHVQNDERLSLDPQLDYAKRKGFQLKHHTFPGNLYHGSFILNKYVREYVLKDIQTIYDEQLHRSNKLQFIEKDMTK